MQPNLAQVLNTLAHEIRTPLAVSQGYLKLYLDGRLTDADDQRRAFQQTREALGVLANLCTDMSKVSALSEHPSPAPSERLTTADLLARIKELPDVEGASWSGDAGNGSIATNSARDLVQAAAIVARAAFDEAREEPRMMRAAASADTLMLLAGTAAGVDALAAGPDAADARDVDFARGGKGLKLIWAAFILHQHRVRTWAHPSHRAAAGLQIPLENA